MESRTTDPIKLLYVLGAGRSGSTTLGVALDNVPGVFNTGELFSWFIFQAKPTSDRPTTVEFWGRVRERLTSLESHFGTQYHMGLEHPYSIFGSKRWSGEFKRAHLDANAELIKTVAEERGESLIADTSHYPMRLGRLLKLDPKEIDVHSIYLVRDPRMVMNALRKTVQRHRPMHPLKAVAYCWTVAILSEWTLLKMPRSRKARLRYEDFVADPVGTLGAITDHFQLGTRLETAEDISTGDMFQGNRLRTKETITIAPQPSSAHLTGFWKVVTTIGVLPLLLRYGYLFRS